MIDPKAVTTYAQYNEDLIIRALLPTVKKGFYVDVGANYPVIDSVTKIFYDSGWRGINIEPIKSLHKQLTLNRPNDINLQCGAGAQKGTAVLREYTELLGHSTFDLGQKKAHKPTEKFVEYEVEIIPLAEIFKKYNVKTIDFIKIDVEGFEHEVIKGNDWQKYRPTIICIEANHVVAKWENILTENDYKKFIADGLNEYYIASENWDLTNDFAERVVLLDAHALKQHQQQSWSADSNELVRLNSIIKTERKDRELEAQKANRLASLSLKDQRFYVRLERAVYGLTVDWVRYKKSQRQKTKS